MPLATMKQSFDPSTSKLKSQSKSVKLDFPIEMSFKDDESLDMLSQEVLNNDARLDESHDDFDDEIPDEKTPMRELLSDR